MKLRYIGLLCGASLTLVSCSSKSTVATAGNGQDSAQHLGVADARNETPVLASSGRWVVSVWTATRQSKTDVYAATSVDDGRHFGAPVRVNDVEGEAHVYGEDPPRVAMAAADPGGADAVPSIVVVWPSDRAKQLGMRSARSVDGGKTFSASVSVGDPDVPGERGFQAVTVGADQRMHAVWLDQRRDPETPHHANAGDDWDPMHLIYAAGGTDRWEPETRLASNVCGCCKTAIAIGRDGSVFVAWRNIYPGSLRDISFAVARDGKNFSAPVRVSEDRWAINGCPDDGPTMAIDRIGVVHIVWPTLVNGRQAAIGLFHASTADGLTFTPRQMVQTLGTPKPAHPQMVLDSCGDLALVWDELQDKSRRVALRTLTTADAESSDVRTTILNNDSSGVYPVVATAGDGTLVAAWTEVTLDSERSSIALRRLESVRTCSPPRTTTN
jgi:hypothetical protein